MKLLFAFMTLGESKMVAAVEDAGKVRRVNLKWSAIGDEALLPPTTWADSVQGEVEYQRSNEAHPNPVRNFL